MIKKSTPHLGICILLDLIGCASYAVPVLGEVLDVIWAPVAAILYYRMFKGTIGTFGGLFTFIEELFPGTDVIPSFTLGWIIHFFANRHKSVPFNTAK
ncbi:hypothetical protein LX64_03714 [Chitinophaga skermanii]|uniref:Uncharacterized protein n=1 Tax=Chitinophaga skermanii TaxID=331697 RepID=A0A327QAD1_9BACT|nr:hypothetical protein [Chitinophaga skermanii]RAJ01499.1 hypothetical protein LX64_03714 [Chitinophaga skermanii]